MSQFYNLVVIGGGAAGFFSAINYAELKNESKVLILEKSSKLLSKVRISGGGRCNVTHACFNPKELAASYPRGNKALISAFNKFNSTDVINWFKKRNIELKVEKDGRMFPVSNSSETIISCFMEEVRNLNIEIWRDSELAYIRKKDHSFLLKIIDGREVECEKIIIASGGNPKLKNYDFISGIGHNVIEPVPSLFTFNIPADPIVELMGVSVPEVEIKISGTGLLERGPLMITHWGLSGPVVLKLSAWGAKLLNNKNYDFEIQVNWAPSHNYDQIMDQLLKRVTGSPNKLISSSPLYELPARLWKYLIHRSGIPEFANWTQLQSKGRIRLIELIRGSGFKVKGKTTFKEEFVTCGGVDLSEINFKTMESKLMPGIYFAGEVLDIDGITGGYNFQSAWTTGYIAGISASGSN